ncbi:PREDICTED: ribonuclease H2 subunit C isoform X2 [Acromyrmex echinatior]|uniref:ribonuclease H2 subunit C isoform X2 n=1 Tax=Acromyrmex echinatior TaxID=103372 RepID=UPI000580FBF6|nr:PREDICTED: ribonuclease H2 subunit C isoform X2 [Acromyrmex echinatior]
MVTRLHINEKDLVNRDESELHFMPCKIHGDEAANVSSFFKPYIRKLDEEWKKITVPAGFRGMMFMENKKTETENKDRNLYCTGTFSQLMYWNYDKIPSKNDAFVAALDWVDIAKVLHSPET